ncbi:MAG: sialate O-acetylesterase, partial [Planctomycetes bacterium]|nr:sialate O-acetylesterase [Planctomycetota bacterium]
LIPTALGGSPLRMWNPEEGKAVLYENMLDMIRKAGGRIKGIVWYQGEADGSPALAATYRKRFQQFVECARRDLHAPQLPFLTAQLNRCTTHDLRISPALGVASPPEVERAWSAVREAQRQVARETPCVYLIPALDLTLGDNIHNSAPSEVILGERFAQVALGKVYGQPALDEFPELVEARLTDGNEIAAAFKHVAGGWCALGPVEDFRVEDEHGVVAIKQVVLGEGGEVRLRLARAAAGKATLHAAYGADPLSRLRDMNRSPLIAFSVQLPSAQK